MSPTPDGKGGWTFDEEDEAEARHRLVFKISVETEIGEVLAVRWDFVPDSLMSPGDYDAWQDVYLHRVANAASAAYIEAAGK